MKVRTVMFDQSDWVPNNRTLPVMLYESVFITQNSTEEFARLFSSHDWQGVWRNGVFDYQHYHSGAHEVLGVGKGDAKLLIGGPAGQIFNVRAGDCLLLPAGTGHMKVQASEEFEVVGAYPKGQKADIKTNAPSHREMESIATLPLPETDPVQGISGPMMTAWNGVSPGPSD